MSGQWLRDRSADGDGLMQHVLRARPAMTPTSYLGVVKLQRAPQVIATPTRLNTTNLTREIVMPKQRTTLPRVCAQCAGAFAARTDLIQRGYGRFCSRSCSQLAQRQSSPLTCEQCGTIFHRGVAKRKKRSYCSPDCYLKATIAVADAKFWSQMDRSGECWISTGGAADSRGRGYRFFIRDGKHVSAHRLSYTLTYGPIPDGMNVCHKCDNPPCGRPDHLFLGTNADNMRDMAEKDRSLFGRRNSQAKLTDDAVVRLRHLCANGGVTYAELARTFGVCPSTIRRAVKGIRWRRVVMSETPLGTAVARRTVVE